MRKTLIAILISVGLSTPLGAGTGLNCYEVEEMEDNEFDACADQADEWLNDSYQQLLKERKDMPHQISLLKDMQRAWMKLRDAQCELASGSTGSNAALVGLTCEVVLTQKRADDLEKMATDGTFYSY